MLGCVDRPHGDKIDLGIPEGPGGTPVCKMFVLIIFIVTYHSERRMSDCIYLCSKSPMNFSARILFEPTSNVSIHVYS